MKNLLFLFAAISITRISNAQNVGIGTNNPSDQLHTTGTVRFQNYSGFGTRLLYIDSAGRLTPPPTGNYFAGNTSFPIPDNGCGTNTGVSSSINVTGLPAAVASSGISVRLNITHTNDPDVSVYLISPGGTYILNLTAGIGFGGQNYRNTIFADDAPGNIFYIGTAPFSGRYQPRGLSTTLCAVTENVNTFSGIGGGSIIPNGIWTLKVFDNLPGSTGTLDNWQISFEGQDAFGTSNVTGTVPYFNNGNLALSNLTYDGGSYTGINNLNPSAALDVKGSIHADSVGIGIVPTQKLEVNGNIQIPASSNFQYAGPRADTLFLGPLAFSRSGGSSGFPLTEFTGEYINLDGTGAPGTAQGYEAAPVVLPTGAVITAIAGIFEDHSTTAFVAIDLYKLTWGSAVGVSAISHGDNSPATATSVSAVTLNGNSLPVTIDNLNAHYSLRATIPNDVNSKFFGARIIYTKRRL